MTDADDGAITATLVSRLVAEQLPRWGGLPVRPVDPQGWDNATFRLGNELLVRLPNGDAYAAQVDKEHRWLPALARDLPLQVPEPVAKGRPGAGFPRPWSVYRWIEGEPASTVDEGDLPALATALGGFLTALHRIPPFMGPPPGAHSFGRGGPLRAYDAEARAAAAELSDGVDVEAVGAVWDAALAARWSGAARWVHGDIAPSNLLVRDGRLSAVIDFGCCCVGDPACDLAIAWTFFGGESREAFRASIRIDPATWARARGWALWKALLVHRGHGPDEARLGWRRGAREVVDDLLADHAQSKR
jgi:aminoglycoside phosphotransferase (APT) family kinase protein